ncbi:SAM hydrolase/SAM-dependent halogenase family protein [Actinomadura litoris]|uniref:SAM hydrolase/SAM-dependent halogenase family protein n=1 Tax=Actinomadura litoris TaxID=2678616 RepID=UPI001FA80AF2|nr:SAM-dependent chlorinase/fluorinase [Actinomadura litoris]
MSVAPSFAPPFVSLTTDFGAAYTAICAGVVHTIAPGATVLVLSDEVRPYAVAEGAMLLVQALPYLPVGVHVGVVDPGVGTPRRPLAVETGRGDVLVGPDNGLLVPAAEELGGVVRAHALENPAYRLPRVSSTFHGRDIFSPAAAHLAGGADIAAFGPRVAPLPLDVAPPRAEDGVLTAAYLYTDRFGSVVVNAGPDDLAAALGPVAFGAALEVSWPGRAARVTFAETFGSVPVGEPLLLTDSSGRLGFAVNQGSAAERFGFRGEAVAVRLAD